MAGELVLVVDDEAHVREILGTLLGAEGHEVVSCAGFDEASAAVVGGDFDLAFLDITLGGSSPGLEVLRLLRDRL